MKRRTAVAGQFYSGTSAKLSAQVSQYIEKYPLREKVLGIVSPHAGLMYSGAVAGAVYSKIEFPHTFILLGPNHTGLGSPISIMAFGEWEVPTGILKIDEILAEKILQFSDVIEEDAQSHSLEHSIEVQLPFILHFSSDVMIVPITMMANSLADCRLVGDALAKAVKDTTYPAVIVASSDMSHYETGQVARAKDKNAIDRILDLDPDGLHETVRREKISMCGFAPVTAMLFAANSLGARKAELIKYMTSGDVSGDYSYVVGYAGIIIK